MEQAKEAVRRLLDALPDEVTLEDIQYHIYVQQAVQQGLDAVDRGELVDQEEIERRMAKYVVTEIRPLAETDKLRPAGLAEGEFVVPDDFDDPLPDELLDAFEGR